MSSIPLDYQTLRVIWWLFLGVLLIGFAVMDGFDLGTAMLLPFVARTDSERRVTINAIGPFWDGNRSGSFSAAARSSPPGRWSMRRRSPASTSPCFWCWRR